MAYTTIDNPELYFQCKLYTGNGSTQAITFDGSENMRPDFIWCKARGQTRHHYLADVIRGVKGRLRSDANNAEYTANSTSGFDSFDSDGFTLEEDSSSLGLNESGHTMVSWNWKAGTSFSNDASATGVGSIDSTGSFNNDAGFSIVSYTGTGSAGTVKHGLNSVPSMIIVKTRSAAKEWFIYHQALGNTKEIYLESTDAAYDGTAAWNSTTPTSSVFSLGSHTKTNGSSDTIIAYCFAEKKGYSKFGSYTGNGNADGTFVYTGFRPAFLITKRTDSSSSGDWNITDSTRNPNNVIGQILYTNLTNAEGSGSVYDFYSNGFKIRESGAGTNASGSPYIYMAFAESPFVNSNGIPNNAR